MLEIKNVSKTYKTKNGLKNEVLKQINLKFSSNGLTFILGKSGSGKSTLLNLIGGLDNYDSGEIIIDNVSTKKFKDSDFDSYRNNYVGFIFQEFNIIEDYTIYENIILPLKLQNKKVNENEIDDLLKKLDIEELKTRKLNELSGGQKQRVAIARALVKKPKIILADEPTGNLDSKNGIEVMNLLKKISNDTLVIVVTHDSDFANKYGDRIIEISDGKIISDSNDSIDSKIELYRNNQTKLPMNDVLKLGYKSLNNHKIKLFFTIILISLSTIFVLLAFIMNTYSIEDNHLKLIKENNIDIFEIKKYNYDENQKIRFEVNLDNNSILEIKDNLEEENYLVYYLDEQISTIKFLGLNIYEQEDLFNDPPTLENDMYTYIPNKIKIIEDGNNLIDQEIIGIYPTSNDEILISNYLADFIINNGIYNYDTKIIEYFDDYNELVNSKIKINFGSSNYAIISGIINYDLSKYNNLKGKYKSQFKIDNRISQNDFNRSIDLDNAVNNLYNIIYVKNDFINHLNTKDTKLSNNNKYEVVINNSNLNIDINCLDKEIDYYDGKEWKKTSSLKGNEAILNLNSFIKDREDYEKKLEVYILKHPKQDKVNLEKQFIISYFNFDSYINKTIGLNVYENMYYTIGKKPSKQFDNIKIIGFTGLSYFAQTYETYFSKDILDQYTDEYIKVDSIIFKENDEKKVQNIINEFNYTSKYTLYTMYYNSIETYYRSMSYIKKFVVIGLSIFIIFSFILIGSLVASSIVSRKKDIGILKSLGAKKIDIIRIFILEDFILAIMSSIVSIIFLIILFIFLNNTMMETNYVAINAFYMNPKLMIFTFIYIFILVIVSSIVPLIKMTKMKPIDSILGK